MYGYGPFSQISVMRIICLAIILLAFLTGCKPETVTVHPDSYIQWYYDENKLQFHVHLINEENEEIKLEHLKIIIKDKNIVKALKQDDGKISLGNTYTLGPNESRMVESELIDFDPKGINEQMLNQAFYIQLYVKETLIEYELDSLNVVREK
ncbi:hypothetical protein ACFYKX_02625 [Cytobacillus sp. FJAT-54145]|uniref:Lipoprotein n=1 Tax=Cytobacillus spartinae TaxID=3299023 RepID=A0ABW6K9A2_9BACI